VLFKGDYTMWNYDVMPDGQRFVMIEGVASDVAGEIALVHNWFEELKARAPKNGAPPAIRTPAAVQR